MEKTIIKLTFQTRTFFCLYILPTMKHSISLGRATEVSLLQADWHQLFLICFTTISSFTAVWPVTPNHSYAGVQHKHHNHYLCLLCWLRRLRCCITFGLHCSCRRECVCVSVRCVCSLGPWTIHDSGSFICSAIFMCRIYFWHKDWIELNYDNCTV